MGATEAVSALRGHPLAHATKSILLLVKIDRKTRKYLPAVVPGNRSVNLNAIKSLYSARYVEYRRQPNEPVRS